MLAAMMSSSTGGGDRDRHGDGVGHPLISSSLRSSASGTFPTPEPLSIDMEERECIVDEEATASHHQSPTSSSSVRKKRKCLRPWSRDVILRMTLGFTVFNFLMLSAAFLSIPSPEQFQKIMDKGQDRMMERYDRKMKEKLHNNPKTSLFADVMDKLFDPEDGEDNSSSAAAHKMVTKPTTTKSAALRVQSAAADEEDHPILAMIRDALDGQQQQISPQSIYGLTHHHQQQHRDGGSGGGGGGLMIG